MTDKEKLQESVLLALQENSTGSNVENIDYVSIHVSGGVPHINGLTINWLGRNKNELAEFLPKFFPNEAVEQLMNFDNNQATEIHEPRNSNRCSRSCTFTLPDNKTLTISGEYNRTAPESDESLTQEEAVNQIKDRLETIYDEISTPEYIEIKGEIGGDTETYRIYKDGHISAK